MYIAWCIWTLNINRRPQASDRSHFCRTHRAAPRRAIKGAVMDVTETLRAAAATKRSTDVAKDQPITLDLGNFAAMDPQPIDRHSLRSAYATSAHQHCGDGVAR